MDLTIRLSDFVIACATLAGPILAVQAQKWLERDRAVKERRRQIFRILMSTRATPLSPAHVEALNAVPVEFYGPEKPDMKQIVDDWRSYMDVLGDNKTNPDVWEVKRREQLVDLLFCMGSYLGYGFSKSQINNDVYYPKAHGDIETDQAVIRRGLAKLLSGEMSIPMAVKEFPVSPEALKGQEELRQQLSAWLSGTSAVKVEEVGQANADGQPVQRNDQPSSRRRSRAV